MSAGSAARSAIAWVVTFALAGAVGGVLGWVSWRFWVIGLFGLVAGLAVGWVVVVLTVWLGRVQPVLLPVAAVLLSWSVLQVAEDGHHRRANVMQFAKQRVGERETSSEELEHLYEFLADESDRELDREVQRTVGSRGPIGRWVLRAQDGVRLAGSWREGRSLPVGVLGAILANLLEVAMAIFIAMRIVRRMETTGRAN